MKNFLREYTIRFFWFALLSGVGWLCDVGTYALLIKLDATSPATANFLSSFVGVTFVYFTSLRFVFKRASRQATYFILIYWGYHFFSASIYSAILSFVVLEVENAMGLTPPLAAKLIITPFNLLTNYISMSFLGRYMKASHDVK